MSDSANRHRLAVLGYHYVGEPSNGQGRTRWYLPIDTFCQQLEYLSNSKWTVIGIDRFLRALAEPQTLPADSALLTFDDCHRSMLNVALPWLQRFSYPAVAFATTDYVGRENSYDIECAPQEPLCDWDDLRELEAAGVSIQSHSATHRGLSWLDADEREDELRRSKAAIERELEKQVDLFALPYGDDGVDPVELEAMYKRTGYRAAFLFGGGPNALPFADPYRLERIAIEDTTDLESIFAEQ